MSVMTLGPPVRRCHLEISGNRVVAEIYEDDQNVTLIASGTFRQGRGRGRAIVELDRETFYGAVKAAEDAGLTALRLADLVEHFTGSRPLLSIEKRPLFER